MLEGQLNSENVELYCQMKHVIRHYRTNSSKNWQYGQHQKLTFLYYSQFWIIAGGSPSFDEKETEKIPENECDNGRVLFQVPINETDSNHSSYSTVNSEINDNFLSILEGVMSKLSSILCEYIFDRPFTTISIVIVMLYRCVSFVIGMIIIIVLSVGPFKEVTQYITLWLATFVKMTTTVGRRIGCKNDIWHRMSCKKRSIFIIVGRIMARIGG